MLESRGSWRRERGGGGERASDSVSTGEVCGVTASPSQSVAVVVAQPAAPRWLMRLSGHTLPTTLLRRPHSTQPRPPQPRHALHALRGTVALKTSLVPHFGCLYEAIIPFARRRLCLANRQTGGSEAARPRKVPPAETAAPGPSATRLHVRHQSDAEDKKGLITKIIMFYCEKTHQ